MTSRVAYTFFFFFVSLAVPGGAPAPEVPAAGPGAGPAREEPAPLSSPGLGLRAGEEGAGEEGAGATVRALDCLGAGGAGLVGVGVLSRTLLAMLESAAAEEDLADLCLETGEGGGMALLGVRKEEPAGVEVRSSSSRPSNWGMLDMLESAARDEALVDLGREPGVEGGIGLPLIGV